MRALIRRTVWDSVLPCNNEGVPLHSTVLPKQNWSFVCHCIRKDVTEAHVTELDVAKGILLEFAPHKTYPVTFK